MATQNEIKEIKKMQAVRLKPKQQLQLHVNDDVDVICIIRGRWIAYLPPRTGSTIKFSNLGNRTITVDVLTIDRFENDKLHSILMGMGYRVSYADSCS